MSSSPSTLLRYANSNDLDDDGRPKRTGNAWSASVHVTTAVIGSGIVTFAWNMAQLGWIFGPASILLCSFVTYYTSTLLAACYRSEEENGTRNYTYIHAAQSNFGGIKRKIFGVVFYMNLFAVAIDYTKESSTSIIAIWSSNCFDSSGEKKRCNLNNKLPNIIFGVVQIFLSQISGFNQYPYVIILNTIMCFTYPTIAIALSIAQAAGAGKFKGSVTGISIGTVTAPEKIWRIFKAFGQIAFAYSFFSVFFEIQDTIKSSPTETSTMKKALLVGIGTATILYMLCGCSGYAISGDLVPTNLLTSFVSYKSNWLTDIANVALLIHLIGSYQVFSQPLFLFVEKLAADRFPRFQPYNQKLFCLVWRSILVIITIVISMFLPFIKEGVGTIEAIGFWAMTIYFPIEIYTVQKKIPKWSIKWVWFQILKSASLIITIAAAGGLIAEAVLKS